MCNSGRIMPSMTRLCRTDVQLSKGLCRGGRDSVGQMCNCPKDYAVEDAIL